MLSRIFELASKRFDAQLILRWQDPVLSEIRACANVNASADKQDIQPASEWQELPDEFDDADCDRTAAHVERELAGLGVPASEFAARQRRTNAGGLNATTTADPAVPVCDTQAQLHRPSNPAPCHTQSARGSDATLAGGSDR